VLHENLKVLDLSECDVSDDSLHHFSKCPNITKIDLNAAKQSRHNITSEGNIPQHWYQNYNNFLLCIKVS